MYPFNLNLVFEFSVSFLFLAICGIASTFAQTPVLIPYSVENGLLSQKVFDLHLDHTGKLWIGTDIGIMAYDGYAFSEFTSEGLPSTAIRGIAEIDNSILAFNEIGELFEIEAGGLSIVPIPEIQSDHRHTIAFDLDVSIYFGNRGLEVYDYEAQSVKGFDLDIQGEIQDLVIARDERIYLLSDDGLYFMASGTWLPKSISLPLSLDLESLKLHYSRGRIFLTGSERYQPQAFEIDELEVNRLPIPLTGSTIEKFLLDYDDNYWSLTYDGAQVYDERYRLIQEVLSGRSITDMIQDMEGTYWISTLQDGLYKLPNLYMELFNPSNSQLLYGNVTQLAQIQDDDILAAFNQGSIQRIKNSEVVVPTYYSDDDSPPVSIVVDSYTQTFYTVQNSLLSFNLRSSSKGRTLYSGLISDFAMNQNQDFLLSTSDALLLRMHNHEISDFSTEHYLLRHFEKDLVIGRFIPIFSERTLCVEFDRLNPGSFWIGTQEGLFYITPDTLLSLDHNQSEIIAHEIVQHADGKAWVLTKGQGLYVLEQDQIERHLDMSSGLASNVMTAIDFDESIVWLGTNRGINILNTLGENLSYLTAEEGILGTSINDLLVTENYVWIAANQGIIRLPKNYKLNGNELPTVSINRMTVDDQNVALEYPSHFQTRNKNFKFFLQPISLNKKIKDISYRLDGLEEEWNKLGNISAEVNYPALPDGEFTFQVKVINKNDKSSTLVSSPTLVVEKTFIQTNMFKIGIVLLSALITTLIIFLVVRNIKRKQQLELDLYQSKLKAINLQMNPHFVYNVLNSVQSYVLESDPLGANKILGKFANILRQTLDLSNQDFIPLETELNAITEYVELENLKSNKNIELLIYRQNFTANDELSIPPLIFQPVIENAIIHAYDSTKNNLKITLDLLIQEHKLICKIKDNGLGFKKDVDLSQIRLNRRYGLNSIIERIELFKRYFNQDYGFLIDKNQTDQRGTLVQFELPVIK